MARYIDVDKLIEEYDRVHIGAAGGARKLMVEAPTADVAEVKHGRKAESSISNTGLMCTACFSDIDSDAVFCKYCGAKMDGDS